jgi:hypothetical protein
MVIRVLSVRTKCDYCGEDINGLAHKKESLALCGACWNLEFLEHSLADWVTKVELAEKLDPITYKDPVFCESMAKGDYGEGYFSSLRSLLERQVYLEGTALEKLPQLVWACTSYGFSINGRDILSDALENHHEDAIHEISPKAIKQLCKYLDTWCKRNQVISWVVDYKRVLLLNPDVVKTVLALPKENVNAESEK